MKLCNLTQQTTAPLNHPRGPVIFAPDLWDMLAEYRKRHEQSGLVRLGTRVVLGLVGNDIQLESAADHLAVSCQTDTDLLELAQRCADLGELLRNRLDKSKVEMAK